MRITGRKGQRILTSRAKSIPSIRPGSRIFGAFTLDGIEFAVFKQPRRELAQFGVVLDNQHRSTILLGLSHIHAPPLSVRYDPHPIVA